MRVLRVREAMLLMCAVLMMSSCRGRMLPGGHGNEVGEVAASGTSQEAAQAGLVTLRSLVQQDNFQGLGFSSVEQAARAQLSDPMRVFSVRLDSLTGYKGEANAFGLLQDAHKLIYPVSVDQQVVSSLSVMERGDGWRATDFGNSALTRALVAHKQSPGDFVVWVPALKIYFSARGTGEALTLTPIMDDPRFDFQAGQGIPASRVFAVLQRSAEGYNGLPQ
jgi:hypothetical protein